MVMVNLSYIVSNVKQDSFWWDRDWTAYKGKQSSDSIAIEAVTQSWVGQ